MTDGNEQYTPQELARFARDRIWGESDEVDVVRHSDATLAEAAGQTAPGPPDDGPVVQAST